MLFEMLYNLCIACTEIGFGLQLINKYNNKWFIPILGPMGNINLVQVMQPVHIPLYKNILLSDIVHAN